MEIAFQPAPGGAFAALQWELEIPAGALALEGTPLTKVPLVVKDAGKSVQCAVSKRSAESLVLACILAGGQKPIPAGMIVLLSMKIGFGARAGAARIRVQNAVGVTGEAKQTPIEAAEADLTIRSR